MNYLWIYEEEKEIIEREDLFRFSRKFTEKRDDGAGQIIYRMEFEGFVSEIFTDSVTLGKHLQSKIM